MKRIFFASLLLITVTAATAQREDKEEKTGGFKKENLFTGGDFTASFYSGGTVLGISPYFGYSLNKIIDAGVAMNFTYTGERQYSGDKYRQYVYGPGVFARIFPIKMLFLQGSFEHNFINVNFTPANSGVKQKYNVEANSLLIGGGYASGRQGVGGSPFFYFSIMVDITKDINSPYVEQLQDGSLRAQPIIKAGVQVPLFQGGNGGSRRENRDNGNRRRSRFD